MDVPIEDRTHESLFFTKSYVLTSLIERCLLRMGESGVDIVSLAGLMKEYILYAPSNANVIARIVNQPVNLVYDKLLKHVESLDGYKNAGIKRVETIHGPIYLCPLRKLEDLLFERTYKKARQGSIQRVEKPKKQEVFQKYHSRQEVLGSIDKQRFEKFVKAGVLPDSDNYSAHDINAVLLKMEGHIIVDELLEECIVDDEEKFEAAKKRIYSALIKPEIQIAYGVTDIGVKEPLYVVERERFSHAVRKIVDLI